MRRLQVHQELLFIVVQHVTALTEFMLRSPETRSPLLLSGNSLMFRLVQISQGFVLGHGCVFSLCQSVIEAYLRKRGLAYKVTSVLSWRQVSLQ